MNKIFTFLAAIIVATSVFAQSPEKLSYQAVLRNASRQLVVSQRVGMQISILQGSVDGAAVYIETQIDTTSVSGMVTIEIGTGVTSDDFSAINWSNGPYFVKIETDPNGGTDYTMTGVSQLMSVPYAFHAKSAVAVTGSITESQISDLQNYLTTETDPTFTTWDRSTGISITESQVSDLQTYLTAETDPTFTTWDRSTGISITESQVSDLQTYLTAETDPVYAASQASNVSATDITNLGNLSGTNTGDQDLSSLATRANVLELNNITPFTPNADYEPATMRYVDDAIDAATSGHYVGEIYGGGIVFFVTPDGTHGLIASLDDLDGGSGVQWGPLATVVGSVSMTDGEANTPAIVATSPGAGTAAVLCDDYAGGGYGDWYLPSNREMYLLASHDVLIDYILDNDGDSNTNGFIQEYFTPAGGIYWSSTEWGGDNVFVYRFYQGRNDVSTKDDSRKVRAIRSF